MFADQYIRLLILSCFCFLSIPSPANNNTSPANTITISSPDNRIKFLVEVKSGLLSYSVDFNKIKVIESSALGIQLNGKPPDNDGTIGKVTYYKLNETYSYRGVHSTAFNKCNGAKISINGVAPFIVEARVFNDGVAFRYIINNKDSAIIEKDNTEFILPAASIIWSQSNIKYYEGRYSKKLIDTLRAGELMGPPVTIEWTDG